MSEIIQSPKKERKPKSVEDEIAAAREKLKKLEERQREQQRKERERNAKMVLDLIHAEKLDTVSADAWRSAMPTIKEVLLKKTDE